MTDSIADMLTRIRNALAVRKETVVLPSSQKKVALAKLLAIEGLIERFDEHEVPGNRRELTLVLKYDKSGKSIINDLKRVSKPSRRVYVKKDDIKGVREGYGIAVISTSRGLMTDREAKKAALGGEVVCEVF